MEESVRREEGFLEQISEVFGCREQDVRTYSPLTLAYIGDGVYDLVIRTVVVERANRPAHALHGQTIRYVNAALQARLAEALLPVLDEEEEAVYRRGRNAKPYAKAKNATASDYHKATGLEALIGFLYLSGRMDRALELVRLGLEKLELEI